MANSNPSRIIIDEPIAATGSETILDLSEGATIAAHLEHLHDAWSSASRTRLGFSRQQWHHPATLDLVEAIDARVDLTNALRGIGEARARAGLSLDETMADLAVLAELVPDDAIVTHEEAARLTEVHRVDTLRSAGLVGTAWSEAFYDDIVAPGCNDPLTGLVTDRYLEARIGELYRQSAATGRRPAAMAALVVSQIHCREHSPFSTMSRRIRAAGRLRKAFADADTVAVLEPTQAMVALTRRSADLGREVAAYAARSTDDAVWVEPLPATLDEAIALVRELANIPRTSSVAARAAVGHP